MNMVFRLGIMKRKLLLIIGLLFCFAFSAKATHQRAAEITYTWLGGNAYEFTLTCFTYTPSPAGLQRDSLLVQWGDGTEEYIPRVVLQNLGDDYTLNVYKKIHNFSSSGTYTISMEDANRNYGVVNVPNSVMVPMHIETELVINPFLGYNNSVQLLNAPVDKGCVGKLYLHNPSAYDPDGDSLSYRLVTCKGMDGMDIAGYTFPQASQSFDIDPMTGELRWDVPLVQGEYNVAIMVEEWRHGVKIGSVVRDMQILISSCDNNLPEIHCEDAYCVEAGQQLSFVVSGSDPNSDNVTLTASGAPFEWSQNPAFMNPETAFGLHPEFEFVWNTSCMQVRNTPYQVVIHAKDDDTPVSLTNVKTINISVLGPRVEGLTATAQGSDVRLSWEVYPCPNAEALLIYRKAGCDGYEPDDCETGIRPGYQLLATLSDVFATSYTDQGLSQGVSYEYRIVARFHDGAESVVSQAACVMLKNDLPLMTHVSNDSLDLASGHVLARWAKPKEIDAQFVAPYRYRLTRVIDGASAVVYEGADTTFKDLNVDLGAYTLLIYKVEMHDAQNQSMGESTPASAIALSSQGSNRVVHLNWTESVAWIIDSTQVYKQVEGHFVKVATVNTMSYSDTQVQNDVEYRYYVCTFGHYAIGGLMRPLVNYSAIVAATPNDDEPPATPTLTVDTDCEAVTNLLSWTTPPDDDLAGFKVYYEAPTQTTYALLTTVENPAARSYLHDDLESVLGCYFIRAFDEKGNLSQPSDTICIDNEVCPVYELPNVFTPNGDGFNDLFEPKHAQLSVILKAKTVIFNRWGNVVWDTDDPLIQWDGKNRNSKLDCPAGTYFFVSEINYQSLTGEEQMRLQGSITLVR